MNITHSKIPTHPSNTAILLVNLGTPDAPTPLAVAKFLGKFLSDRRVRLIPKLFWNFILYGFIIPKRMIPVARNYRAIWTIKGSPLKIITEQLAKALNAQLSKQYSDIWVKYAMTYSTPTINQAIKQLLSQHNKDKNDRNHIKKLIILPLFPQYSATTSGAVFDAVADVFKNRCIVPSLFFIHDYALDNHYLDAIKESITHFWSLQCKPDRLLISFHALPKQCTENGDPYIKTCYRMKDALSKKCNFPENFVEIGFQSRLNRSFTEPCSLSILDQWARCGIQNVDIIAPSFPVDCLETLEELAIQHARYFKKMGGNSLRYIPALNDSEAHICALTKIISKIL